MPIRAIIFDCDGVLIDSEVISAEVLIELAADHGIPLTRAYVRDHFLGRSFPTVARTIREGFAIDLPADFEARYRAELLVRFDGRLQPTSGIAPLLGRLRLPFCCATSSSAPRVAQSLALAGLAGFFGPRVYTASQVARGKPAPDLFLFAAAQIGIDPADCLVIEDSRPGITAAQAAGMAVLLYTGGSHLDGRGFDTDPPVTAFGDWAAFGAICPAAFAPGDPRADDA